MSYSAAKFKRDPFAFINIHSVAKHQKTRRGPFGDIENFFEKKLQSVGKNRKGGPFSPVRFLRLCLNKTRVGLFGKTKMRFPGIRLVSFS